MCWWLNNLALPLGLNVIAGLVSGYYVARTFEFRDVRARACFALRPFAMTPECAEQTIIELYMCRDQLISLGFPSVQATFDETIGWAQEHRDDRIVEVAGKRHKYMLLLEHLKPKWYELLFGRCYESTRLQQH